MSSIFRREQPKLSFDLLEQISQKLRVKVSIGLLSVWTGTVRGLRKRCMSVENCITPQKSFIWQVNQFITQTLMLM